MFTVRWRDLCCLAALTLASAIATAQEAKPQPKPPAADSAAGPAQIESNLSPRQASGQRVREQPIKIEAALQQPATLEFVETPLRDIVDFLQEAHGIPIVINEKALLEVDVSADSPLTKVLRGIRLETALGIILRELGLVFNVSDELIEITTSKDLASRPLVKVYDCRDLLALGPMGTPVEGVVQGLEAVPSDAESLKQTLTRSIDANSWNTASGGGTIEVFKGMLIISHHSQTHRQIERLLNTLRETAGLEPRAGKAIR